MTNKHFAKVLVANRGEVALRIVRALGELAIPSVTVYSQDDRQALHASAGDAAQPLAGKGPAAYLDIGALLDIARREGCDAVHPGYGFLSERADFASACEDAGIRFIGPTPAQLALFGDKAAARALAERCDVPVMPGSSGAVTLEQARQFFRAQQGRGIMIKALGGGGGRGMRAVLDEDGLEAAYQRCHSEALAAFGTAGVYVERLMGHARHIEVQIVGDGERMVCLGERECTVQRRFQKVVEIAPSPSLGEDLRRRLFDDALRMAGQVGYQGLGTFEFLVDPTARELPYVFIEANPRLQVEHTVTEEVTGIDLVQLQIGIAAGQGLQALGLAPGAECRPRGFAIQWRVSAETLDAAGQAIPASGTLAHFDLPAGPGIRVDTHGQAGISPSPHFDTLLAKVVVHVRDNSFAACLRRSQRALQEFRIAGLATNLGLLQALARRPEMASQLVHTRWLESVLPELVAEAHRLDRAAPALPAAPGEARPDAAATPDNMLAATMPSRVASLSVAAGDTVAAGAELAIFEAMKMEHLLVAPYAARIEAVHIQLGDYLVEGQPLFTLERMDGLDASAGVNDAEGSDPSQIRADLQGVLDRTALTLDAARPQAIAKRHTLGARTARENIADLCDEGSFIEYGAFAIAAQRGRRALDDLVRNTPADGMITGIGSVNGQVCGDEASRTAVLSYDPTVLAGTQGYYNHMKTDRMLEVAVAERLPTVLFAEGGGGRPGDIDKLSISGLHQRTFANFAALSGQAPVVGITSGRCFAGNAALLACSDVIIATRGSNIGMGGPAMIEGGGLGVYTPEQIGPSAVQHANGVIDVLVRNEREAVQSARKYLGFFQGRQRQWGATDQRHLRTVVPENRLRAYGAEPVLRHLVDTDSLMMLRTGFGVGIHTALARLEGRAIGLVANNPLHLGGAIDADAVDKAARFLQLCDTHGLPVVSLIDTPGFMVGPEIESAAHVKRVGQWFVAAAQLRVPHFSVVLRKGYGLGAMAMAAGSFRSSFFTVSWPTGEFGGMGLEGAVRLGFKKELDAVPEGVQRDALFNTLLAKLYDRGGAINVATCLEIDAVIDPAETRAWLVRGLNSAHRGGARGNG